MSADSVVVQVPAFQEGSEMLPVLEQIHQQPVPDGVDVDYQLWVTLSPPDKELCTTWQAAIEAEGFEVYEAPSGKLSARNAAHNTAVRDGHDIIVSWDADAEPLSEMTLANLIVPMRAGEASCANSNPYSLPAGLFGVVVDVFSSVEDVTVPHIHGQLHALTADAWRQAGPFDDSIDQTDSAAVRAEEEFDFRRRLRTQTEHGVVDVADATVYNDPRRAYCQVPGMGQNPYCSQRGVRTFSPPNRR